MSKRVIYSGFGTRTQGVVDLLHSKYDWVPVFFNSTKCTRKWAQVGYPEAIHVVEMDLRKGIFDYSKIGSMIPVGSKVINDLKEHEFGFFQLTEDATGWNFSFLELHRYYHDALHYWNTVIQRTKPDIFVALNWPHTAPAYALYLLCKYYYKIEVLFLDPVPQLNEDLHVIGTTLEDLAAPFRRLYASNEALEPGPNVKNYLRQIRASEHEMAPHNQEDIKIWKSDIGSQFLETLRLLAKVIKGSAFKECDVAWKKNRQPFDTSKSKFTHFEYFWFTNRIRQRDVQLKRTYTRLAVHPDYGRKYLYFAASLQPETTTLIFGGAYADHALALEILSASVPKDWVIYYKEHPATFYPGVKSSLKRSEYFYNRIRKLGNVVLIQPDTNSFDLIDNSMAVASVTGSSSFEAVVRGRPGIFFGNVWYQACQSLFRIDTLENCKQVIEKIESGYLPDQHDIERYLAAIEKVAIKNLNYRQLIRKGVSTLELEKIADAMYAQYTSKYREILSGDSKRSELVENV